MKLQLTPEYKRRIQESIKHHQRLLDKELSYSKDLQNQETLDRYNANIAKLQNMLTQDYLEM